MSPCRCLLKDIRKDDILQAIRDLTAALPEAFRCDESLYENRLSVCRECSSLLDGLCLKCGCYVEYRCAHLKMHCPDVPSRW